MSRIAYFARREYRDPLAVRVVDVHAGWDRPLQHFYLTITDCSPGIESAGEVLYTSLDAPEGGLATPALVLNVLRMFDVPAHPDLATLLEAHRRRNAGNDFATLNEIYEIQEENRNA